MEGERAIRATVRGVVQGVGFRYSTRLAAQRLGVVGSVRNAADGSVQVTAQGTAPAVEGFIEFLRRGPRHARVASLEVVDVEPTPGWNGFEVTA